jgi:hypothetical protein
VQGCREQSSIEVRLSCVVRYSYNGSYVYYKWQRSTNNGNTWADISGTSGVGSASLVAGLWQYTTNYNFWANGADSGHRFRVVVATSAANLASNTCAFNDGTYTYLRFIRCNGLVKVKLVSFTGSVTNGKSLLHWATDNEQNFSHYEVEKSTDGRNFSSIGNVPGQNNSSRATYQLPDPELLIGTAWYRLKMVDENGMFEYSNTIALSNTRMLFNVISPANPFSESIALRYTVPLAGYITAVLYDPAGRQVSHQQFFATAGFNSNLITGLQNLAAGIYTLRVNYKEERYTAKLVKIQ